MIENTYAEVGTILGTAVVAIITTLKFSNGKGGRAEISVGDVAKLVTKKDCKDEHVEVKADQELNRKEHKEIQKTCSFIQKDVAVLIERSKPK